MRIFYRHIGAGEPVGAALAATKRELIRNGAPPAAWAGLVVLGTGDVSPWSRDPLPPTRKIPRGLLLAILGSAVAAILALLLLRRSR